MRYSWQKTYKYLVLTCKADRLLSPFDISWPCGYLVVIALWFSL
uniref:Uncharacterized protein n=1 Tax=Arundo donax TaxID=35708 RepID=A0A0A9A9I2_ARUDO